MVASFPGSHVWPGNEARVMAASFPGSHMWPGNEARVMVASFPGSHMWPGNEARVMGLLSYASLIPRLSRNANLHAWRTWYLFYVSMTSSN